MSILVTGYTGQLGYDVVKEGNARGLNMTGVSSADFDITDGLSTLQFVRNMEPDVIIHCAAYTAVDKAEEERETCWNTNVIGTENLAKAAKDIDAKFLYVSTDYVFHGEGNVPFHEEDIPDPIGYYGFSKYIGEKRVENILEKYFILRISWVFGTNGNNFVKTMLKLAETRTTLDIVSDQYGSPTYTFHLARLIIDMIRTDKFGIYHASNEGYCTWADFAIAIFYKTRNKVDVNPISTEEFPTKAVRPKNSRMSKDKLVKKGFKPLPSWDEALDHYLQQLKDEVK
ncbi:dTDP-4-dehydrorhamnose reductase [Bacillus sp. SB49]|uniref:dTDP-4-dehydrorhamnose reductase n=1 Tax=Bacillus sp. SB49 TaxID=1071080 RepID=UPI0004246DF6|nr:dTDP-4-dehydrorhamnose reductase [Bacillus sp. SB49]QHT48018.1 dTDP-4-dehydrorhamnose reductase [Bacillus sp. SB49]